MQVMPRVLNSQETDHENRCNGHLLPSRHVEFPYQRHGHQHDDEIRKQIRRRENSEHGEGIGAFRQKEEDWGPIPVPSGSALEDRSEKERQAPCDYNANHDPTENNKSACSPRKYTHP